MTVPLEDKPIESELNNELHDRSSKFDKKYPYISVIITVHDRKEFIKEAIYSVINQTLNRALYEIIVVKNFDDQEIDKIILEENIINIKVKVHSLIGDDLSRAIEKAKGDVIAFLDDDDLFMDNKLEIVYRTFMEQKNLVYFHNDEYFIDDNGNQAKFWLNNGNEDLILKDIKSFSEMWKLQKEGLVFNMSSISIKRNKIIEYLRQLEEINTNQDDFMFLVSTLENDGIIMLSGEKLTKYRLHNSASINLNNDRDEFLNHKIGRLKDSIVEEKIIIVPLDRNKIYRMFVKFVLIIDRINLHLLDNKDDIKLNDLIFYSFMSFKIKSLKSKRDCLYHLTLFILSKISYDQVREFYRSRSFKYNQNITSRYLKSK